MNVARMLYPVKTLGPGNRLGIWLCGCHRRCKGCSNPELWNEQPEYEISVTALSKIIEKLSAEKEIDGFTITGGEPLNQAKDLSGLMENLRNISTDILLYTGYKIEEVVAGQKQDMMDCIKKAAVVVDGEYIEERNYGWNMVGSSNQRVIISNELVKNKYLLYLEHTELAVQNFVGEDGIYSIGIHKSDFSNEMSYQLNKMRSIEAYE